MRLSWRLPGAATPKLAVLFVVWLAAVPHARAAERLCDPSFQNCRSPLLELIRAERIGIDVAFWFMTDRRYSNALIERFRAGVPVRVLADTRANRAHPANGTLIDEMAAAGIPIRTRTANGILHWKMMLFAGQNTVQFSAANYSGGAFVPITPYSNYVDEAIYFTDDPSLVNSFKTKYDSLWINTTKYADYANVRSRTREYPVFPTDPELNFAPAEDYGARAVKRYHAEAARIDVIMFRVTDRRHTDAMIAAVKRGIPVRLITEPKQYRDPKRFWHSWNVDRMWQAGVKVRHRKHAGTTHQKSVLLYGQRMTIFGSSNWTSPSSKKQEEHNYFTHKSWIFLWFADQFERKWRNLTGVLETKPFVPLPPGRPQNRFPANGATGVALMPALKWYAGLWAHQYDTYLGADPTRLQRVAANRQLGPSRTTSDLKSYALQTTLKPGTTYYWRIVSKTMALKAAAGPVWSFTTRR